MVRALLCAALIVTAGSPQQSTLPLDPSAYQDVRYRLIGPFRASRTVAGVGIPTQPNVFFVGVHTGGVWKTDDYGRTWRPIFDSAPTGSIGDIGVSWSNPEILYVGTGEGLHRPDLGVGDGIFKSTDGGQSWKHVGLGDVQQVGRLVVHPTDPNIVFVAGLGHPYGPNTERGIFRTINGGTTWERVLFVNENTGGVQVEFDPRNPNIVYGSLWEHREGPWENASFSGPNSGLYKSTDGGTTWTQLKGGLPTGAQGAGRICLGISASDPNRLYAAVMGQGRGAEGFYRSNDGGRELDAREHRRATRPRRARAPDAIPTSSTSATSPRIDRTTAARRGRRSRARRAATTISGSGSTRSSRTSCSSRRTREPSSR